MFEAGATINEVQKRLGHKDVKTTMNIYSHVTPQQAENTSQKLANYLGFWQIDSFSDSIYEIEGKQKAKNVIISTFLAYR